MTQSGDRKVAHAADGTEIHFKTFGDRTNPAIFLGPHFYMTPPVDDGSYTETWIRCLLDDFHVIVADYPRGVGKTGSPQGLDFNPEIAAGDYVRISDAAGVDRFGWLGYSYGGAIGVQLACRTDRVSALAIGGFPPLNAPFNQMIEILSAVANGPREAIRDIDPQVVWTALGFYQPLKHWAEREEVSKLNMPKLVFMGDRDTAQGMPPPLTVPLAANLRTAENELRAMNWSVAWLKGHDHVSAIHPDISLALVQSFFLEALK